MPLPDCDCKVINGKNGYVRDNSSWIIGRILRDFEWWMDAHDRDSARERKAGKRPIYECLDGILSQKWRIEQEKSEKEIPGSGASIPKPSQAGLCISIYKAGDAHPGHPGYDKLYFTGFVTAIIQLGIAAIPCGIFGDWGILMITASGIILSLAVGSLSQWKKEKWACRTRNSKKTVVLTRGNGSQHAIVVMGDGKGLDLEDLAAGPTNVNVSSSYSTRIGILSLAVMWILLLITASAIGENTWFLLAVGGIGILQNIFVAGSERRPEAFGIPLKFERVIGKSKVMDTLFEVEEAYPKLGRSMLDTFFPGKLRPNEEQRWQELEDRTK